MVPQNPLYDALHKTHAFKVYMYAYLYLESSYVESTGKMSQNSHLGLEHVGNNSLLLSTWHMFVKYAQAVCDKVSMI
jgi:hypothetical protein